LCAFGWLLQNEKIAEVVSWCKDEFIQHIVVGIWISAENIISPN
jgi:hypothetical protein